MRIRLLSFVALLALLLVSTAILADGRPTGLRIGRLVSGGGTNVQLDITVPGTDYYYESYSTDVWLGYTLPNRGGGTFDARQYESSARNVPLPWAIDWGDSYYRDEVVLFGPSGGPFTATFSHTYATPGTYTVTVGDALCCSEGRIEVQKGNGSPTVITGNAITDSTRYVWTGDGPFIYTWYYPSPVILAVTANATVTTGTGIPALNVYGLLAMALVLVGSGLALYRKPRNVAT